MPGTRVQRPMRGFGIPRSLTLANLLPVGVGVLNSAYTQAGPGPGTSRAQDSTSRLQLVPSGAQTADLVVRVGLGGVGVREGCEVSFKVNGEADSLYRQWAAPNCFWGWTTAEFSVDTYEIWSMATIPSNQRVILVYKRVGDSKAFARIWDPATRVYGAAVDLNVATGLGIGGATQGSVVVLPGVTERILVLADQTVISSDDEGATWRHYSDDGPNPTAPGTRQHTAANHDGQLLTILQTAVANQTEQWASDDLGVSWSLVETAILPGTSCDVCHLPGGGFGVLVISAALTAAFRRIGSPFDPLTGAVSTTITYPSTIGDVTAVTDADGTIVVFGRLATGVVLVDRSIDGGRTFQRYTESAVNTGDAATFPRDLVAAATAGQVLIAHRWTTAPSTEDNSVGSMLFGGWSNLVPAFPTGASGPLTRWSWGGNGDPAATWMAIELPENVTGWALTTTGGTRTLVAGKLDISTVAQTSFVDQLFGVQDRWNVIAEFEVTAGGSLAVTAAGFRVRSSNGVNAAIVEINASTAGFDVVDGTTAALLGSVVTSMATPIQVWVRIVGHVVLAVRWRRPADVLWQDVTIAANLSLTAVFATGRIAWGDIVAVGGATTSRWRFLHYATQRISSALGIPSGIGIGRALGSGPYPIPGMASGASYGFLGLRAGPGSIGELYDVRTRYAFGVERIFPEQSPSPDDRHRTTSTAEVIYAFDLGAESLVGKSIFLWLGGVNYRQALLERSDGAVWTTVGTWDSAQGFNGLSYARTGDSVRPNGGVAAGRFLAAMEAVGGTVRLAAGFARRCVHNLAGAWTGTVLPELRIALQGGEPAAGTLILSFPAGVLIVHTAGLRYRYWRVRIPAAQDVSDAFYETGGLLLGTVQPIGSEHGWGWEHEVDSSIEDERSPYGTSRTRELGPPARTFTASWTEGADQTAIRSTPDLDYQAPSVDLAGLAARRDVWGLLWGILEDLNSGARPGLALPAIPDTSGLTLTDRTLFVYGRLRGSVRTKGVVGDEGISELVRVDSVSVEEIR